MYVPHVIAVMVGQEIMVKNDDPFLHNVHSLATDNPAFNFGQPNKDAGKKVESPKAAEIYQDQVRRAPVDERVHRRVRAPVLRGQQGRRQVHDQGQRCPTASTR